MHQHQKNSKMKSKTNRSFLRKIAGSAAIFVAPAQARSGQIKTDTPPAPVSAQPVDRTDFGMRLFDILSKKQSENFARDPSNQMKDLVVSPICVEGALSMMQAATGVPHFEREQARDAFENLAGFLGPRPENIPETANDIMERNSSEMGVEFNVANGIFVQSGRGLPGGGSFADKIGNPETWNGAVEEVSSNDPINKFISEKTKDHIKDLLDGPLSAVTVVNAVYLKAEFTYAFDQELTETSGRRFTKSNGDEVTSKDDGLQMMRGTQKNGIGHGEVNFPGTGDHAGDITFLSYGRKNKDTHKSEGSLFAFVGMPPKKKN